MAALGAAPPAPAPPSLEERVRVAEADVGDALLALYPKLLLIVFAALNVAVALAFASQTRAFAAGEAFMRSHLTVAFESMSARRPLPGFMATVPAP
jgi:hypothetical protein